MLTLQESAEKGIDSLNSFLMGIKEGLSNLPQDSLESMTSTLKVHKAIEIFKKKKKLSLTICFVAKMRQADLQSADEEATRLYKDLNEIAMYSESQKLIAILIGIRPKIKEYMSQVNQGLKTCEEVRAIQVKRRGELSPYLQFLEETDNWLKGITLTLSELNANSCTVF